MEMMNSLPIKNIKWLQHRRVVAAALWPSGVRGRTQIMMALSYPLPSAKSMDNLNHSRRGPKAAIVAPSPAPSAFLSLGIDPMLVVCCVYTKRCEKLLKRIIAMANIISLVVMAYSPVLTCRRILSIILTFVQNFTTMR